MPRRSMMSTPFSLGGQRRGSVATVIAAKTVYVLLHLYIKSSFVVPLGLSTSSLLQGAALAVRTIGSSTSHNLQKNLNQSNTVYNNGKVYSDTSLRLPDRTQKSEERRCRLRKFVTTSTTSSSDNNCSCAGEQNLSGGASSATNTAGGAAPSGGAPGNAATTDGLDDLHDVDVDQALLPTLPDNIFTDNIMPFLSSRLGDVRQTSTKTIEERVQEVNDLLSWEHKQQNKDKKQFQPWWQNDDPPTVSAAARILQGRTTSLRDLCSSKHRFRFALANKHCYKSFQDGIEEEKRKIEEKEREQRRLQREAEDERMRRNSVAAGGGEDDEDFLPPRREIYHAVPVYREREELRSEPGPLPLHDFDDGSRADPPEGMTCFGVSSTQFDGPDGPGGGPDRDGGAGRVRVGGGARKILPPSVLAATGTWANNHATGTATNEVGDHETDSAVSDIGTPSCGSEDEVDEVEEGDLHSCNTSEHQEHQACFVDRTRRRATAANPSVHPTASARTTPVLRLHLSQHGRDDAAGTGNYTKRMNLRDSTGHDDSRKNYKQLAHKFVQDLRARIIMLAGTAEHQVDALENQQVVVVNSVGGTSTTGGSSSSSSSTASSNGTRSFLQNPPK
ncbi:unnamed protein product [Amoebophrya sp. A120]|nr:unnamed protein product [Amoebophrya sp. A120]|eukprot:GSA120T00021912001.1